MVGRTIRRTRESLAPYEGQAFEKISVSLPAGLVARARDAATSRGSSVSAVVSDALREALEADDQARLDEVLAADAAESIQTAEEMLPYAAALLAESCW
jgi:hypothetical protein